MLRWLNAREWLEHERLTGLPHADFASEALAQFDELEPMQDEIFDVLNGTGLAPARGSLAAEVAEAINNETSDIAKHVEDCPGKTVDDRVEWAVSQLEQITETVGGDLADVVTSVDAADQRWWDIWDVLVEAGVVDRNDKCADVDVPGLLRMFLPEAS